MFLPFSAEPGDEESVTTPFEDWCAARGLRPDDSRAWPLFEASRAQQKPEEGGPSQTSAAS